MVNEPPFHCQGDPVRRGNMELTCRFQSPLAPRKARNWPSFINDQTRAYLEPSLTSLTCTASISSLLPTSQAAQAHRQSLTNSACAQACPTGLFRAHTPRNPSAVTKSGCLTSAKGKHHLTPLLRAHKFSPSTSALVLPGSWGKLAFPFLSPATHTLHPPPELLPPSHLKGRVTF